MWLLLLGLCPMQLFQTRSWKSKLPKRVFEQAATGSGAMGNLPLFQKSCFKEGCLICLRINLCMFTVSIQREVEPFLIWWQGTCTACQRRVDRGQHGLEFVHLWLCDLAGVSTSLVTIDHAVIHCLALTFSSISSECSLYNLFPLLATPKKKHLGLADFVCWFWSIVY